MRFWRALGWRELRGQMNKTGGGWAFGFIFIKYYIVTCISLYHMLMFNLLIEYIKHKHNIKEIKTIIYGQGPHLSSGNFT
jgi:c-di-GMP-related signal transduction protein